MRVLVVCTQSPWPPNSGAPLRTQAWIRTASKFADIGLVVLVRSDAEAELAEQARSVCAYLKIVRQPLSTIRRLALRPVALAALEPFYYREMLSDAMHRAVRDAISEWAPDVVQAEWIGSARYLEAAVARSIPCVYSAHNVEHRVIAGTPGTLTGTAVRPFVAGMARLERLWAARAAAVSVVSADDAAWFRTVARRTYTVPNGVMPSSYTFRPPSLRRGGPVGFIGTLGYLPNQSAARVVATKIYPRLAAHFPELGCLIAGRSPNRLVRSLAGGGVHVDGDVADMTDHWATISVLISPLTWGGGSRLKLLEAAAVGAPIVATRASAEGLAFEPGRDYLNGETAEELADCALAVLRDPARADALASQARKTLLAQHDWSGFAETMAGMYRDVCGAASCVMPAESAP